MYKKIISFILCTLMCASLCAGVSAEQEAFDGYVYFTAERITLGQGFAVEPMKVGFYKNETLAHITERALGDRSTYTGDLEYYYLESIIDGGEPSGWTQNDVPKDIKKAAGSIGTRTRNDRLSAMDYCSTAGWMFMLDNRGIDLGAGGVTYADTADTTHFTDGSVVRLQFSVYGWGEDINIGWGIYPFETTNTFADKSKLIKMIAQINDENSEESFGESYTEAMNVLSDWDATEEEISGAIKKLEAPVSSFDAKITESAGKVNININTLKDLNTYIAFYNADKTLNKVAVHKIKSGESQISEPIISGTTYKVFFWTDEMKVIK